MISKKALPERIFLAAYFITVLCEERNCISFPFPEEYGIYEIYIDSTKFCPHWRRWRTVSCVAASA